MLLLGWELQQKNQENIRRNSKRKQCNWGEKELVLQSGHRLRTWGSLLGARMNRIKSAQLCYLHICQQNCAFLPLAGPVCTFQLFRVCLCSGQYRTVSPELQTPSNGSVLRNVPSRRCNAPASLQQNNCLQVGIWLTLSLVLGCKVLDAQSLTHRSTEQKKGQSGQGQTAAKG